MEQKKLNIKRKIAIPDFNGPGRHVYEDEMGWRIEHRREANTAVSRELFEYYVVRVGLNLGFYYMDDDNFYGIHSELIPTDVKRFPQDRSEKYIGWRCECDTHRDGEVIYSFDEPDMRMWDEIRINGKSLEEVIERSYILALN